MFSGTRYLLKEHKKCISELEHLKGLLSELHRYVDLIVERGVALRGAFEDLRSGHYLNFSVSFFVKKTLICPLLAGETQFSSVPPSNSIVSVSDP